MADKEHAKGLAWLHHKAAEVAEQKRSNPAPTETISLISQFLIGNTVERQSSTSVHCISEQVTVHIIPSLSLKKAPATMTEPTKVHSRAKRRKFLLSLPRRLATEEPAATPTEPCLLGRSTLYCGDNLVQDLMPGAKFVVGVEWIPRRTRPGLHPVFAKRKGRLVTKPFVRPGCEPVPRRPWGTEIKPGYLERQQACMPGQDDLVLPCLSEALGLGRALVEQRDQVLDSLGAVRRLLAARRNATSETDVAMQVSELERGSSAARSVLTSMNAD